ncbi:MAG TPA: T9SS type A sorting domain-containing protein, partial [Flavisolibacter sp.]|nr:T9SS type A sorting domain-containing protein [Flavisolibacter sp.]
KDVTSMKYEIERKAPGETGFKKIGERAGSGSVFATRSHQFTDSLINQQAGSFEYRIHHFMDTTAGADYYLNTITLNLASACVPPVVPVAENGVVLMPNPASNLISLKITTPAAVQNLRIQISDAQGKRVAVQSKSKGAGTVTLPVSISGLSRGKYFVSVYADGVLMATKELLKL